MHLLFAGAANPHATVVVRSGMAGTANDRHFVQQLSLTGQQFAELLTGQVSDPDDDCSR